jgi:hypothetical protein
MNVAGIDGMMFALATRQPFQTPVGREVGWGMAFLIRISDFAAQYHHEGYP